MTHFSSVGRAATSAKELIVCCSASRELTVLFARDVDGVANAADVVFLQTNLAHWGKYVRWHGLLKCTA